MSEPKDLSADLVFQVFNEIGIIDSLANTELTRHIAPNLNTSEFAVLNHLARLGGGKTPSWLAKAFQMTRPSMTAIVSKLSAKGYVRVEAGEKDRREKFVWITDAGLDARRDALQRLKPRLEQVIADFGAERLRALLPLAMAFRAYLDEERNERDGLA
ncbi:MAG: MarR family transcriptional regulator [Pseudomonadota bacterium]